MYDTNHFFRVDKGFVAQVAAVVGGRTVPLNAQQEEEAVKLVPLEVVNGVRHDAPGVLSMGRLADPNSGTSSFSILLGAAPHLDMQYTIFGRVLNGMEALRKMERIETFKEGIFVKPKERVTIHSSYVYTNETGACQRDLADLTERYRAQEKYLMEVRAKCLPGS